MHEVETLAREQCVDAAGELVAGEDEVGIGPAGHEAGDVITDPAEDRPFLRDLEGLDAREFAERGQRLVDTAGGRLTAPEETKGRDVVLPAQDAERVVRPDLDAAVGRVGQRLAEE